jgi:phosphoglycolate phosphatase-like HAD superfamily hydrolase
MIKNKLLLFDIDGTLLSTHGIPRIAMGNVLNSMYNNFTYDEHYSFSGRTDWEIIEHLLNFDQRESSPKLVKDIMQSFAVELQIHLKNGRPPLVYDGVRELLNELSTLPNVYLGLVTGNIESGAKIKLSLANLWTYFAIGSYGDDARNRSDLPPIAITRAQEVYNTDFKNQNIWIIGDSEHDISCAKDNQLRSLAVSTGWTDHDLLAEQNPDYLVTDFSDVDAIRNILIEG